MIRNGLQSFGLVTSSHKWGCLNVSGSLNAPAIVTGVLPRRRRGPQAAGRALLLVAPGLGPLSPRFTRVHLGWERRVEGEQGKPRTYPAPPPTPVCKDPRGWRESSGAGVSCLARRLLPVSPPPRGARPPGDPEPRSARLPRAPKGSEIRSYWLRFSYSHQVSHAPGGRRGSGQPSGRDYPGVTSTSQRGIRIK